MRSTSWLRGLSERLLQTPTRQPASSRNPRHPAQAEVLETRQLLAAQVFLSGGGVSISDSEVDDAVTAEAVDADNIRIRVVSGSTTIEQVFAKSGISGINFIANLGNDKLTNLTTLPARMNGGVGADTLIGGSGVDIFFGEDGDDRFEGAGGNDTAFGGNGHDLLIGGGGADSLEGHAGNDTINADSGDDTVMGGEGIDSLNGGTGSDRISETFSSGTQYVLAQNSATSTDSVKNFESASIVGSASNDRIDLSGFTFPATISGGAEQDTLFGGSAADVLSGDTGQDTLVGGGGNDSLFGGAGNDSLTGGSGDDVINGGAGSSDFVSETADANLTLTDSSITGAGNDRLVTIEFAQLTGGDGNNTLDASAFTKGNVTLIGGAGNDSLIGTASTDHLSGGLGSDTLDGGNGRDTLFETGDDLSLESGVLRESGTTLNSQTGVEDFKINGTAANSRLSVSGVAVGNGVTLSGGGGDDTLTAGSGISTGVRLVGGSGVDRMITSANGGASITDLRNNLFSEIGKVMTLAEIEIAELTGDESANTIDATAFSGQTLLRGMGGQRHAAWRGRRQHVDRAEQATIRSLAARGPIGPWRKPTPI